MAIKLRALWMSAKYITTSIGDVIDFKVERIDEEYLLRINLILF